MRVVNSYCQRTLSVPKEGDEGSIPSGAPLSGRKPVLADKCNGVWGLWFVWEVLRILSSRAFKTSAWFAGLSHTRRKLQCRR